MTGANPGSRKEKGKPSEKYPGGKFKKGEMKSSRLESTVREATARHKERGGNDIKFEGGGAQPPPAVI